MSYTIDPKKTNTCRVFSEFNLMTALKKRDFIYVGPLGVFSNVHNKN